MASVRSVLREFLLFLQLLRVFLGIKAANFRKWWRRFRRSRRLRSSWSQSESSSLFRPFRKKKETADEESLIGDSTQDEESQTLTIQNTTQETTQQATQDSTARRKRCCTILSVVVLWILQLLGFIGLGIYCYQTISCAKTVHVPHYHCENGTSGIGHETAMNVELAFVRSEVVSRVMFLAFCFRLERWAGVRDILFRLFFISNVWPLVLYFLSASVRFLMILLDEKDLGTYKKIAKATIGLYIIDDFAILIVVCVLNYVKIKDLAVRFRVSKFVFRFVLFCFWLQFFTYVITALFQFISGVMESTSASMGKWENDILRLVTKAGQLAFMKITSGCLWDKLVDDGKRILGERSDEKDR